MKLLQGLIDQINKTEQALQSQGYANSKILMQRNANMLSNTNINAMQAQPMQENKQQHKLAVA